MDAGIAMTEPRKAKKWPGVETGVILGYSRVQTRCGGANERPFEQAVRHLESRIVGRFDRADARKRGNFRFKGSMMTTRPAVGAIEIKKYW